MAVYQIQPLQDPRWPAFVVGHPSSSVFHTVAWLEALYRTYGYPAVVLTTSPPDTPLQDGLVLCRVESWITGRRLISLPFSDHCEPLWEAVTSESALLGALELTLQRERFRYIEIRPPHPLTTTAGAFCSTENYCFHQLDLQPDLATLFDNCHKSSTQRKIQRAEREGLVVETGRSGALLDAFWNLLLLTRRRHRIPPQPKAWFRNLIDCFGEALQIRVAFKDKAPVAAILTLRHKDTLVYKYGCSDARLNSLGGTHLLFWNAIQEAKSDGVRTFDLGRSDPDNSGLITFKDRWGAARSTITYSRLFSAPPREGLRQRGVEWVRRFGRPVISHMPDRVLQLVGSALYRHSA